MRSIGATVLKAFMVFLALPASFTFGQASEGPVTGSVSTRVQAGKYNRGNRILRYRYELDAWQLNVSNFKIKGSLGGGVWRTYDKTQYIIKGRGAGAQGSGCDL